MPTGVKGVICFTCKPMLHGIGFRKLLAMLVMYCTQELGNSSLLQTQYAWYHFRSPHRYNAFQTTDAIFKPLHLRSPHPFFECKRLGHPYSLSFSGLVCIAQTRNMCVGAEAIAAVASNAAERSSWPTGCVSIFESLKRFGKAEPANFEKSINRRVNACASLHGQIR